MAMLTGSTGATTKNAPNNRNQKQSFAEGQRLAKLKSYERQAKKKRIGLQDMAVFTQQLSSMLEAGLPLISALEALQEQTENPVFAIVIRDVKTDISQGASFSEALRKFPNAFPNLLVSMVEAGEASGELAGIMARVADYFEGSVKLTKKVKSALMYPVAVIGLAVVLVNVLLIFVIPVFAGMFDEFGKDLPAPTQALIRTSDFLGSWRGGVLFIGLIIGFFIWRAFIKTPNGRRVKDKIISVLPILSNLSRKMNVGRFCRTYAILLRAGVPLLKSLEICGKASGNTYLEDAVDSISREVSQGGQMSETVAQIPYFPPMVKHMARAGERTGNVDGMMTKVADFYDNEVDNIVSGLTSLLEPILICFLGVVIGGIVMAMFLPIFQLSSVVGG